jgi:NADH dehydrogenase (ubiquinone) 1 alpha/beta subcomplex 1
MFSRIAAPVVRNAFANTVRRVATPRIMAIRGFSSQTFLDRSEVSERVLGVLKNFEKVQASKITETAKFIEDLGLDSLDVVEVVMAVEEEFVIEIPDSEAERLMTPAQVIDYVAAHPMAK